MCVIGLLAGLFGVYALGVVWVVAMICFERWFWWFIRDVSGVCYCSLAFFYFKFITFSCFGLVFVWLGLWVGFGVFALSALFTGFRWIG